MAIEKAHILYIDEAVNFSNFESAFQLYYDIFTAETATEAIEILHQYPIAVIIVNQSLAGLDGIEFLKTIIPEFPDPIRMLIAEANDADLMIKAINDAQIFRFITKPWNEDELKQSIDVGIRIYQLEKKNREHISRMHEEAVKLERLLSLFRKYVPGYVIDEGLTKNIDSLFKGETRYVTIVFANINNISQFIAKTEPPKLLNYLKRYFSFMSNCIKEHKGVVDKFYSGTLLGIFGAPISYINNEENAVFCALDMLELLKKFNAEYAKQFDFETSISIGINAGEAVVGNIGSEKYLSYTAVGHTVNTTSRIVELAIKELPNSILVSESVYQAVKNDIAIETMGRKEILSKQLIPVYKVIAKKI